ncbi:MAG: 1,4-alpha-glucan branching protein GlgB [Candidatus Omnitrophica bacterium]|nr:1,4-alpha-glucan branching protein GlgB [Candidatus Omnitrophota bacterium]
MNVNSEKNIYHDASLLTDFDVGLFQAGKHFRLYEKLGAHLTQREGVAGTSFAVWAPNAQTVSVAGDFNGWDRHAHKLVLRWDNSGIWEGFIPGVGLRAVYKFFIASKYNGYCAEKKDPYSFCCETPPQTASVVWDLDYTWKDQAWMSSRKKKNALNAPMSIYEVHLGSWCRKIEDGGRFLSYQELSSQLVDYVRSMGFTHVELMPVMDHPFYGSWGYQTLGYFASTRIYGNPQELMQLIEAFHQNDIGVILDWVPSHFPSDEHGLGYFDGTHLYEHSDPQKGFHPDWKCNIFNNGRNEVKEFLISSALFWFDKYHVDGLRVDAVASMLYLDYSRQEGEWTPNIHGGRDNIESIEFIEELNEVVYANYPDVQMVAEESTAWAKVSHPTSVGGLGFGMKWNMGWMHDTLEYFKKNTIHRKYHHNELTFSMLYAFTENFVLSLSHDEVVHGKRSLLEKMPGDDWQKFANLRLLFSYMYAHPGKKLLFMGSEIAQRSEWYHEQSLDWHLLEDPFHQGVQKLIKDINGFYKNEPALHVNDFELKGFEWINPNDWEQSVLCFMRRGLTKEDVLVVACNFTPVPRENYRIGVPFSGKWKEVFNSDDLSYGGGGIGNPQEIVSEDDASHGRRKSIQLTLPPLGVVYLKRTGG